MHLGLAQIKIAGATALVFSPSRFFVLIAGGAVKETQAGIVLDKMAGYPVPRDPRRWQRSIKAASPLGCPAAGGCIVASGSPGTAKGCSIIGEAIWCIPYLPHNQSIPLLIPGRHYLITAAGPRHHKSAWARRNGRPSPFCLPLLVLPL